MAMMAKMRSLAPWFIITVGGLFVLFMVISDSNLSQVFGARTNNVGYINDEPVTYQEFSALVERYRQAQVQQTGRDIDESQMEAFRDQVWDAYVSQVLMQNKMEEYGIFVTDEEIKEAILGPNPPEIIKQSFIDSTGNFNRAAYDQAIQNPANKEAMIQVEDAVRQQKLQEKLESFLNSTIVVSDDEVKRRYIEQNIKMTADYALIDVNTILDTQVTVTDSDIKKYYDKNLDKYKIEPQRKIKYVLFRREASAADSSGIKNNLKAIVEKIKADTSSFKTYVEIYSDQPYSRDTVGLDRLPGESGTLVSEAPKGSIVGPVLTFEGYVVYRVVDKVKSSDEFVRASHILVSTNTNPDAAKAKADSLYALLANGADFAKLAMEHSQDPGSGSKGGDLGWFGKGMMVKEFEDASFNGKLNEVQKPIKSNFGYHIIKVTGKSNEKFVIEKIANKIEPSATTMDNLYSSAEDFVFLADKDGFEPVAQEFNYNILETPGFKEDAVTIPGLGQNKGLTRFAFDNSLGSISEVFKVNAGYVVATVSEIIKAGFKPLEEVEAQVRREVIKEMKLAETKKIAEQVYSKIKGTGNLSQAAQFYDKAKVSTAARFGTGGGIPGLGNEYAFSNYAIDAPLNQISEPVVGNKGTFLIKVTQRDEFDQANFDAQKPAIRDNIFQQKKSRVFTDWVANLKKEADIVDERYKFYR